MQKARLGVPFFRSTVITFEFDKLSSKSLLPINRFGQDVET